MRRHRAHAVLGGFLTVFAVVLGGAAWDAGAVCPLPSDPLQQLEIVISIVDTNHDGGLSLTEIQALYPGMTSMYFTLADGNRDGKITAAELLPWLSMLPGLNLLNLVDGNLNGAIEYAEVAAYVTPEQFALVDINGDGVVDCLDIGGGPVEGEGEDPGDPPCPIGDVTADTLIRLVLILVDTSGDGSLSLGEVRAVYPELEAVYFTLLDSNRNGLLDAGELAALAAFLPLDDFLAEVDLNGDRLVAYAEVSQYVTPAQFALADLNGNGFVDCEDIDLLTGGTDPGEGEGEGEDPVEGEGEPTPPCPIDFSVANIAAVVVSLLDTNADGGLSLAEIQAIYPDLEPMYFTILDGNRDGKITAAELAAIAVILPLDSYIGMVDPNGDGVIAHAEVSEYLTQAQFDLIDTNNNGVIDCVDVAALTGGVIPGEGEPEGEDPVEGEGEPGPPCPIDFSIANIAAVLVSLLDANGDGGLSLAEIQAIYPDLEPMYFTILDGNRDGKITAAELAAIAAILPVGSYLGMVDPNGDGLISHDEVSEYLTQAQFSMIDANHNGVIDCEDVARLTGGVVPGEGEGEDPGEGEPSGPCPIDFSGVLQTLAPVIVALLDSNGDGGVSLAEIQAVYPGMEAVYFTLLDANRDGKISAAELSAIVGILPVGSFLGMLDPNGDGLIAYSEVSQYLSQSQFTLLDANRNGVIDCEDIAALTGGVIPGEGEPEGEPGAPCPVLDALDIPAILGYVIPLLDRNGDGGLSLAEIQAVYAGLDPMYFALVDLNRDGKVTAAELGMLVNLLPLNQLLGGIDPNGDGVFSYDEVAEYIPRALFDFLDANANGVIDCEDVAALLAGGWIPGGGEGEPPVDPDVCPIPALPAVLADAAVALLDADGDGGVSLAEIQAVYAAFEPAWFGLVDANGDGLVDAAELLRITGMLPLGDLLGFVDANRNGVIEYAEVAAFVTPGQFAVVDVNGDGVFDCHDVEALIPNEGEPEGEEGEGEPGEGEGEPPVDPDICPIPLEENLLLRAFLILFDANRDGVISPAELGSLGVPPAVFAQLDGNRDGVLDLVELRRALRMVDVAQVMREVDINRNGALEYAEVSALVTPAQFALLDATRDGVLDCRDFDGVGPAEGEPEGEEGEGEPGEGEGEPGGPEDWLLRLLERLRASGDLAALMREAFALLDTNQDGALSYAEITARFALPQQVFAVLDINRDGLITPAEIEAFLGAGPVGQPVEVELSRMMGGRFFTPGEPVTVTVRLVKRGPGLLNSLSLLEVLPAGWTITSVLSTAGGAATKADGVNNALALAWAGTMPFPIEVVYEALPAADAPRIGAFAGQADYTAASGQAFSTGVIPTVVARALPPEQAHTADTNRDWRISLAELLRVVQLYNAGAYRAADGTEDGFAPGPGPVGEFLHSADMDGDGNISISELLRTIQLFNAPGGAYYVEDGTEDGFVPGVY